MPDQVPPKFGRTPWDVLLILLGKRSILVWACLVGWGALAAGVFSWYHNALPLRGESKAAPRELSSYQLHWSIYPVSADRSQCHFASMSAQTSSGSKGKEEHDDAASEVFVVGVDEPFVSAIGCAGLPNTPLSVVFVAGPEQTATQNKQRQLRKLLDAHLPRSQP